MLSWTRSEPIEVVLEHLGERYRRYRLASRQAEEAMARSLERCGQLSPIVVCRREDRYEVVDGFKRLAAARALEGLDRLVAKVLDADERSVKVAIYGLNQVGGKIRALEESWLVHALVREDGLSQVEVALLLGRHKSWVCRRLALIEKLCEEARDDLRLGLLTPRTAREVLRLPLGNQQALLDSIHRESLTSTEIKGVVDLLLACGGSSQERSVLARPRDALAQDRACVTIPRDPRLSREGNKVMQRVEALIAFVTRMETWARSGGWARLTPGDRSMLEARFLELGRLGYALGEVCDDLIAEEVAA